MRKAVLANRIFINLRPIDAQKIEEELTYRIPPRMPMDPPIILKGMRRIGSDLYSIPSGREDLIPEGYKIVDKRILIPAKFREPKVTLRPDQLEIFNSVSDSCVINAKPGWGKTFTGLFLASKLGQKTLVIAHNTNLRAQWEDEVRKVFGMNPGVIGSGDFNTESPIVIGNVQTLNNRATEISKMFGTVIMDEVHHVPAATFQKLIDTSYARYKIGLSGTLRRKDGRHVILPDHFTPKVHIAPDNNRMEPEVHIWRSEIKFPDGSATPWASRVNKILYDPEYQKCIAAIATHYAEKGHKVLVVGDRTEFLDNVAFIAGENVAMSITGRADKDLDARREKEKRLEEDISILCGTLAIYKEGISINCLSTLILGTPINNAPLLEQLVGRIQRFYPGKLKPVVIDINMLGKTASRQAAERLQFYRDQGWRIKYL